MEIIFKFAFN